MFESVFSIENYINLRYFPTKECLIFFTWNSMETMVVCILIKQLSVYVLFDEGNHAKTHSKENSNYFMCSKIAYYRGNSVKQIFLWPKSQDT